MLKVLFVLSALTAISTSAPSTVDGGTVVKTGYIGPGSVEAGAVAGGGGIFSILGSIGASKTIQTHAFRPTEVVSEKIIDVEVPPPPPPAPAKKTVIERTVIPQYVEKRVRVPTYVEKTIRVPTYVEKTIKVPAAPTIVEKEISHEEIPVPQHEVKVVEHHLVSTVRPYSVGSHKVVSAGGGTVYSGSGSTYGRSGSGYVGGPVGFSFTAGGSGAGLFNKIFNIPIQTLGAVNGLLNGLARGLTGGVSVSAGKAYSYY